MIGDQLIDSPQPQLSKRRHEEMRMNVDKLVRLKLVLNDSEDLFRRQGFGGNRRGERVLNDCGTHAYYRSLPQNDVLIRSSGHPDEMVAASEAVCAGASHPASRCYTRTRR